MAQILRPAFVRIAICRIEVTVEQERTPSSSVLTFPLLLVSVAVMVVALADLLAGLVARTGCGIMVISSLIFSGFSNVSFCNDTSANFNKIIFVRPSARRRDATRSTKLYDKNMINSPATRWFATTAVSS